MLIDKKGHKGLASRKENVTNHKVSPYSHIHPRYMETSQMSALEEVFISRANCQQRAGRAGRVRPGFCFRLFTQVQHMALKAYGTPELLRVPLEELCLNIMVGLL